MNKIIPALVIEGMEDTGKTCLCQVLQERLEADGYKVQRFTPERLKDSDDLLGWYHSHLRMVLEILRCQNIGGSIPLVDRCFLSFLVYQIRGPHVLHPIWSSISNYSLFLVLLFREEGIKANDYFVLSQAASYSFPCFVKKLGENEYCNEEDIQRILTEYKKLLEG